ncbi:MAG TPA: DnaJ domain-containing protein [Acidimicrobiales bacterium]
MLGVQAGATQPEVRAAYRAAARDHHPDAGGDPARMRAVNVAWAVLGDPVRRAAYDRTLAGGALDPGFVVSDTVSPAYAPWDTDGDHWPIDPDARLTADEWADLADGRPIAPTRALQGWWAILPPAMLLAAIGLFVAGIFFTSPALMAFAAGAFIVAAGLFVLAPLRAMARAPRR